MILRQNPCRIYNQVEPRDPLYNENPPRVPWMFLNSVSGELFTCVDNTIDENIWNGGLGSVVEFIEYWKEDTLEPDFSVLTTNDRKDTLNKLINATYSCRALSARNQSTGKRYFEVEWVGGTSANSQLACGATTNLVDSTTQFGLSSGDFGMSAGGSRVYLGDGEFFVASGGTSVSSSNRVFCFCFNFDDLLFCAGAVGDFYGDGAEADPVTGTNMFTLDAGDYVPGGTIYYENDGLVLNTKGPFQFIPIGYTAWED